MDNGLKSCPFCRGTAHILKHKDIYKMGIVYSYGVFCIKCGAETGSHMKKEKAIAFWNRRGHFTPDSECYTCRAGCLCNA